MQGKGIRNVGPRAELELFFFFFFFKIGVGLIKKVISGQRFEGVEEVSLVAVETNVSAERASSSGWCAQ